MRIPLIQNIRLAALLLVMTSVVLSCKHKYDDPVPTPTPFGSWTKAFPGTEPYNAQLNLKYDGTMA